MPKSKPKKGRKYNIKTVVIEHHKQEINKLAEDLSGAKSGSKQHIGYYSQAVKQVMDGLTEEQKEEYKRIAEEKMTGTLTVEEQQR